MNQKTEFSQNILSDKEIFKHVDKNKLFGMCYPAFMRYKTDAINFKNSFKLMNSLGVKTWRAWMHFPQFMKDPETRLDDQIETMNEILKEAEKYGIEVTGMCHVWFNDGAYSASVMNRDMQDGSNYRNFLINYEKSWEAVVNIFPNIKYWEIGNEWNIDPFLHPLNYEKSSLKSVFSFIEKANITTDMLYHGSKGIHKANPVAKTVLGGLAPDDGLESGQLKNFLNQLYKNIKNGQWPSKITDDYFQILAWHPYACKKPDTNWVRANNEIYDIAVKNGDAGKKVFFTELGFSEKGDPDKEKEYADWISKSYELVKNEMPYVETIHYFRLYEDERADKDRKSKVWGGIVEVYYGLFTEPHNGLKPKTKAYKYRESAGGKGDLREFETTKQNSRN